MPRAVSSRASLRRRQRLVNGVGRSGEQAHLLAGDDRHGARLRQQIERWTAGRSAGRSAATSAARRSGAKIRSARAAAA